MFFFQIYFDVFGIYLFNSIYNTYTYFVSFCSNDIINGDDVLIESDLKSKKKVQFFSVYALKTKSCFNLMKIHTYHLEHVCVYIKYQVIHFYHIFKKRILTSTFCHISKILSTDSQKWLKNGTLSHSFLKRKMFPQLLPTTKSTYFVWYHMIKL